MQKDNIISFVRRERAKRVRLLNTPLLGVPSITRNKPVSEKDKIISLRPRRVHFPFVQEVKNLDIPDGPYYL